MSSMSERQGFMSDLPYSRSQIVAAGKLLRGRVQLSDEA
jgi:hypothetical protein